jgi:hypothetical protein
MRPFELLLVGADLAAVLLLVVRLPARAGRLRQRRRFRCRPWSRSCWWRVRAGSCSRPTRWPGCCGPAARRAGPGNQVGPGGWPPGMGVALGALRLERRRAGGWSETDIHDHLTTTRATFERLPGAGYYVQVPTMFHVNLTDIPLLSPLASRLGLSGPIGMQRAHRIINAYSLAFFDRHLKGRPAALLDGPAKRVVLRSFPPELGLDAFQAASPAPTTPWMCSRSAPLDLRSREQRW